jgi:uncharacterized protein YijF (DUF1287 family)
MLGLGTLSSCRAAPEPNSPARLFLDSLARAAIERTEHDVTYDPGYVAIDYPNGDVPESTGVCTDVIIRSYRAFGIDLQQLVHEDMAGNFELYPSKRIWGLEGTDTNIDHRRVQNLAVFFERHGTSGDVTEEPSGYLPGDIVTWQLGNNMHHIGIVAGDMSEDTDNPLVVHNIGRGPKLEDALFSFEILGLYRYAPGRSFEPPTDPEE